MIRQLSLNRMVYLDQILHAEIFQHWPVTGMQNCDEASPNIVSAGQGILVKMLITCEPYGFFKIFFLFRNIFARSRH